MVLHENLELLSFVDQSLDLIVSFDVLEHIPNARCCMQDAFRCLNQGITPLWTAPFELGETAQYDA